MKLFIIITGLALLVPRVDESGVAVGVEVLFLDTRGHSDSCGAALPEHELSAFRLKESNGPMNTWDKSWTADSPTKISIDSSPNSGAVALDQSWAQAFEIKRLSDDESFTLKGTCLGEDSLQDCKHSDKALLSAQLVLHDGQLSIAEVTQQGNFIKRIPEPPHQVNAPYWMVERVDRNTGNVPSSKFITSKDWCFTQLDTNIEGCPREAPEFRLFNGIVYKLELESTPAVTFRDQVRQLTVQLEPQDSDLCQILDPSHRPDEPCSILRLENQPLETSHMSHSSCLPDDPVNESCVTDVHFQMSYKLLDDERPAATQLVPRLCAENRHWPGEGPNLSRCIPPVAPEQ